MTWLTRTPQAVVQTHLEMLDRLKAEEAMSGGVVTAIGTHALVGTNRDGQKRTAWCGTQWRRWGLTARAGRRQAKPATVEALRGVGIDVRVVKKRNDA